MGMPGETSTSTPPTLSVTSEPDTRPRWRRRELPKNKLINWSQRLRHLSRPSTRLEKREKHKAVDSRMKPTSMLSHSTQQRDHQASQKKRERTPLKMDLMKQQLLVMTNLPLTTLNEHYESAHKG